MGRLDYETAFIDQYSRRSIRGRVEHLLWLVRLHVWEVGVLWLC